MRSLTEPATGLRVLMQIPDLSPDATPARPAREVETFVQQPLAPLAPALPKEAPKPPRKERRGITPEELKNPGRFARPLTVLAVLAAAAVVGIALSRGARQQEPPPLPPELAADATGNSVPGGTPTEITQIPEISFPTTPTLPDESGMRVERLPPIEPKTSTAAAATDGATAQASDGAAFGQPSVARLERRIEQPQPQASR
jgi:hypothetical protein